MTRLAPFIVAPLIIAIVILAGCASDTGIVLRGGQTEAQLAGDRSQCLPFVQAHTETTPELAEAACLVNRGYRAPLPLTQGPAGIGSLYATATRDASVIVADFQGCRVEALTTPMPENREQEGPLGNLLELLRSDVPARLLHEGAARRTSGRSRRSRRA